MLRLQLSEHIEDLKAISANVDDYLSRQLYLDTFGAYSDFTAQDVLKECYGVILTELSDVGITFLDEEDDLLDDFYLCKHVYLVRKFVDVSYLRPILAQKVCFDKVSSLVQADNFEVDFFHTLFEVLAEDAIQDEVFEHLGYISPTVLTDLTFIKHIRAILKQIETNDETIVAPNEEKAKRYLEKIQTVRKLVNVSVDKILANLKSHREDIDHNRLNKLVKEYDLDKVSPEDIHIYSSVDLDEVPQSLTNFKQVMLHKHHLRIPHHIEYWTDPAKKPRPVPTYADLLILVVHHNEPGTDSVEFWEAIESMIDSALHILTPEQMDWMREIGNILFPRNN